MKSGCLLRDEKCDFVMRRTVRATVWIVRILFDRFSMMVKPERTAYEKYAANRFGWWFAEWKRIGQRGNDAESLQPFRRFFVVKKIRMFDLVAKIGIIFVMRDSFGLRATANSPDLSYGSLIVKQRPCQWLTWEPQDLRFCIWHCALSIWQAFASKVCTRRFRKKATSTHPYWKIKYEPHFDMKNDLLFDINYDHRFDRSPFL